MEAAIKKAIGDQLPRQVKELVLDNRCKQSHPSGLENFESLEVLSMNSCGLTSLSPGFPMLPALRRLELSDNRLTGAGLDLLSTHAPRLEVLNLSGNAIRSLDALKPLRGCLHLRVVDCYGCPVSDLKDYRSFMFREIRGLMVLDGKDENGEDVDDEEEEEGDEPDGEENEDDYEDDEEEIREEDAVLRQAYGKTRPADIDDEDDDDRREAEDEDEADYDEEEEEEEGEESDDADSEGEAAVGRRYLAGDIDDDEDDGEDYIYDDGDEEDDDDGDIENEDDFDEEDNDIEGEEEEYDEEEEEEEVDEDEDAEEDVPVSKRHRRT